jgi:hypothetical protein
MSDKNKGRKWDGKSRVSTDLYRNRWDEIFKKNTEKEKLTATEKLIADIDSDPDSWVKGYWEWKDNNKNKL